MTKCSSACRRDRTTRRCAKSRRCARSCRATRKTSILRCGSRGVISDRRLPQGDPRYRRLCAGRAQTLVGFAATADAGARNARDPGPVPARFCRGARGPCAALERDPGDARAWSMRAVINLVQADYDESRRDCIRLAPLVDDAVATGCIAYIDGMTGRARQSHDTVEPAWRGTTDIDADQKLWLLTRLAEMAWRLNDPQPRRAILPARAALERHRRFPARGVCGFPARLRAAAGSGRAAQGLGARRSAAAAAGARRARGRMPRRRASTRPRSPTAMPRHGCAAIPRTSRRSRASVCN